MSILALLGLRSLALHLVTMSSFHSKRNVTHGKEIKKDKKKIK